MLNSEFYSFISSAVGVTLLPAFDLVVLLLILPIRSNRVIVVDFLGV